MSSIQSEELAAEMRRDPEAEAADELCRILESCPHAPRECVQLLKHELRWALQTAFYWHDRARQAERVLALHDAPKSSDSKAIGALRSAVRVMRERCALLEARCLKLLRDAQPEDTQPILLPPAHTSGRAIQ